MPIPFRSTMDELFDTQSNTSVQPPDLDASGNEVKPPDLTPDGKPATPTSIKAEKPEEDSLISKLWKNISSPIPAVSKFATDIGNKLTNTATEPGIMSDLKGFGAGALQGAANLVTPLNLATAGFGGIEAGASKAGLSTIADLANVGGKISGIPTAIHGLSDVMSPDSSLGQRVSGVAEVAGGVLPFMHSPAVGKIGESLASNEPVPSTPEPAPTEQPTPSQIIQPKQNLNAKLPRDLANAKPRFNRGQDQYIPQFDNDIDKSLFIIAQKSPSSRDADYLKFVMDNTGMSEPEARQAGIQIRSMLNQQLRGQEPGEFQIPKLYNPNVPETNTPTIKPQSNEGPSAIIVKKPTPEVLKQVMEKGYTFDSLRDDGAYRFTKSTKPPDIPTPPSNTPGSITPNQPRMMTPPKPDESSTVTDIMQFPKTVMASMNFHAPLRQGLPLIHKKAYWTSLNDMFQAWGSDDAYKQINADIANQPLFKPTIKSDGSSGPSFAEQAGLKLTNLGNVSDREESLVSNLADKIPGVTRSKRAYTTFLNKLRADTFTGLVDDAKNAGNDVTKDLPTARALADFVNTASGRPSLPSIGKVNLEQSATLLNNVLFSPRLMYSRIKMLNPATYVMTPPQVRQEYLKSLLAVAAVGTTLTQLGRMIPGASVESDPTSSDFGKLKVGNTRLDPYGGFQQYVVAANRLIQGRSTSSTGREYDLNNPKRFGGETRLDVAQRFGESKLNPPLGFALSLLNNQKELTGQKMDLTNPNPMQNSIAQRFIPIVIQDIRDVAKDNPGLLPAVVPFATFGGSVQTFGQ